mmetsp:Transcript_16112/g.40380  ORF Transcript_16112/g.40380 Transcript_16112/m.40380 type:complete len:214 (-) Transcript_16112:92-733(-)
MLFRWTSPSPSPLPPLPHFGHDRKEGRACKSRFLIFTSHCLIKSTLLALSFPAIMATTASCFRRILRHTGHLRGPVCSLSLTWELAYCPRQSLHIACPHQVTCQNEDGDSFSSGSQKQTGQEVPFVGMLDRRLLLTDLLIPRNRSMYSKSSVPDFRPAQVCHVSLPAVAAITSSAACSSLSPLLLILLLVPLTPIIGILSTVQTDCEPFTKDY